MGKWILSTTLLFFIVSLSAQTFNGTGGAIPDDGLTPTCFPVAITGVGTINGTYGVASVCFTITHTWDSDLEITLKAPDGTIIPLSIQNGGSGDNYTGTCFTGTATTPITSGSAPFSGSYLSQGALGNVNNGQNANGSWSLCIQDIAAGFSGNLVNWSINFSNTPAQPLAPPANDDPCNAIALPVSSTCTYSNYTNAGAGGTTGVPAPGCANYSGSDVWFQVTVPAGGALNFDTQTGIMTDGGMAIYSGASCNSLALIVCDDDASGNGLMPFINATGLTPGSTVWIRVWEYGNDNNGTFGICVTAPTPPPPLTNDDPCNAIPLSATTSCTYTTYTNAGASGTTGVTAPGCASYSGGDVWFSVTVPPAGALTFDTQEGTMTDGGMAIYSGASCNALTLISCDDDASTNGLMPMIAATGLTPGSTVWVRMWEYSNDNNGTFGICVTIPVLPPGCSSTTPAGNTCAAATPICNFNGYCGNTSASYTADYWTELYDAFDACLGGGTSIENNSFISFVASGTSASFNVWVTNSLFGDGIQLMFYEGGCGAGPVTCHGGYNDVIGGPNLITASGLIPGNTYYLMIDGVAGDVCDYVFDPVSGVDALNVTPSAATICTGSSVNISASGGNGVYAWSPATGLNTTSGANVTATPASTITYTVTSTGTGVCPVTITKQITVAVVNPPAAPTTSPVSYCQGASALPLTATGTNLLWYSTSSGGIGTATAPAPSTASNGSTTYWVSQSTGSCEGPRASITVTISSIPAAPAVTSPVKYCQGAGAVPLTATGTNLLWYTTASGGVGSATPPTPSTASTGSVTYYVSQSNGSCESPRTPITVLVNSTPLIYTHGTNPTCSNVCDGTATVDVTGGTGPFSFLWSNAGITQTITGLCTGTYTVAVTDSNGCVSTNTPKVVPGCFQIQSILVDACSATEYDQEMVFFQVGQSPLNTSSTTVTWPTAADSWNGYCTNAAFITSVNATITGAGVVLPLPGTGILPANANVVLISSTPATSANSFANLTDTLYALFQCPGNTQGHFANNTAAAGVRTLIMNFGAGCTDTASYNTNQLINTNGTTGGSAAINNGAYVNYSTGGSATYLNYGCTIPYSIQSAQVVLTATTAITPTFTPIAAVCQGAAAPVLPTSSTNAIPVTGTWLPAVSTASTGTTTYTFTPTAGQCATTATMSITVNSCTGNFGEFASAAYLTACHNNADTSGFYNTTGSGVNLIGGSTYQGTNLGTYVQNSGTLTLNGGEIKTFKNASLANICGTSLFYTVYSGPRPASPVFTEINMPFFSNCVAGNFADFYGGPCSPGDQKWQTINAGIDLTGMAPGGYTLEIYYQVVGDNNSTSLCRDTSYANNGGSNFISTFTITLPPAITYPAAPFCTSIATGQNVTLTGISGGTFSATPAGLSINNSTGAITPSTSPAGTYTIKYVYNDAHGCTDSVTTAITIKATSSSTTNTSICPSQLPYTWNSNVYNSGGIFKDTLVNAAGCDSVVTLNLTLKAVTTSTTNFSICPADLPFTWNSNSYLTSGSYIVTLLNAAGCDSVATLILTVPDTLIVRSDTSICQGASVILGVSGGSGTYLWTASPADPSLSSPNSANPTVTPAVTTTYTVASSDTANSNLIINGNFSGGNTGFTTDYPYIPNNVSKLKRAYGIVTAPNQFENTFINCGDHTTGSGNMMTVDGSDINAGTDQVWGQGVSVIPGRTYTLSYWIHTINSSASNPAVIAVWINGVKIQANTAPSTSACGDWVNVSFTWNSGAATTASIAFFDENTSGAGNDFALDDITFTGESICPLSKTVTVTVKPITFSTTNTSICPAQLPYTWNSNIYNTGGTYQDTLINAAGCDSIVTLNLTVKSVSASTTNTSICPSQLPYTWNSNIYNAGGTYKDTLTNSVGCDSVVALNLTVKTITTSTTNVSVCPAQLPYSWNSNSYNTGGAYNVTLVNSQGCDSIATLNLTVKTITTSTTNVSVCPAQLPYSWNSNSYNTGGTYNVTLVNSQGCDSIATLNLTVKTVTTSTTNISVCPTQLPYSWNSNSYNVGGTYNVTLVNSQGCDSIATLNLTVKTISTSTTNISICPVQLPYSWNSNSYNAGGTYNVTLVNSQGCDSIATLNLTVKTISTSTTNVSVCPAQLPYSWNSKSYNTGGTYNVTLINSQGCDSIATLNLTIKTISTSTTNVSVCPAQLPYNWNSNSYNTGGTYNVTLVNSQGCDSVATLNLTIKTISTSTTNISICPAQLPYSWNSNSYNTGGTYNVTLVNSQGCDSVATLNLTIKTISTSTTNVSVCPAQLPYNWNGNSYNTGGTYNVTLINSQGCDSIATLNLTIKTISTSTTNVSVCPAQLPYSWNSNSYNTGGTYNVTLVNSQGCDSIATLNLVVKTISTSTTNISICPAQLPYSWNSNSYNTGGTYNVTLINSQGCDSIATLNLTLKTISTSTTNVSVCPAQLPYSWNSNSYNAGGTYNVTLVNSQGCDSIATLNLTIKTISTSTTNVSVCPAQLPYNWNSNSYNTGGTYNVTLVNSQGCDSVATLNLTVKTISTSTTNISICPAQLPYSWNSNSYNTGGTYNVTLVNSQGCDSIATLNLTVKTISTSTTNISVCPAQLPYSWNSNSYNTGGTYNMTLINSQGCDSIATLNLTVKTISTSTTNISVCPAQLPYSWNSHIINSAGTYADTLVGSSGCDSVSTLILTVKAVSSSTTNITVCPAQLPYNWNGNSYNAGGSYNATLVNSQGCDSIATLNLVINAVSSTTTNISICPSQLPYTWNSHIINSAGTYADTLIGSSGCDSISTLILIVKATSASITDITVCPAQLPYSGMATVTTPAALIM
ncbi:MAG: proprotein convertase P-domain-containing protein [Chitinophagaceae bacterium]|nr:proprotein convertase P-domain-containing protein [Chitinophagaceae bacterium]